MSGGRRLLVLGPGEGWHADRLRSAAARRGDSLEFAAYESLAAALDPSCGHRASCERGWLGDFDVVLTRTMPPGTLEQITLRLSVLHAAVEEGLPVVNEPRALEMAIDKYRTLARVAALGYPVPETRVVQSRREAMEAFSALDRDVIVKPLFGGEGRGVMRVHDRELAWVTFSTLENLGAVLYVQRFVPPGGVDTRLLVIGEQVFAVRRTAAEGWKTNVAAGARCEKIEVEEWHRQLAQRIAGDMSLRIAAVDMIDSADGEPKILEVNAVPGWKGAEAALGIDVAEKILEATEGHEKARKVGVCGLFNSEHRVH
ncbi:ATP-grasp domain-containing protein [Candidatus Laterigemmans baculatus]|uniref:ATP-grasp domain-containing protein n=1 Tax=Candidatus Laterigemmans baculatus TaxID=2770505 RepID=UPI001F3118D1|nr:RimK family alpha-L-glutamate ligase [Candidatus Laterigemmans baculatus]